MPSSANPRSTSSDPIRCRGAVGPWRAVGESGLFIEVSLAADSREGEGKSQTVAGAHVEESVESWTP